MRSPFFVDRPGNDSPRFPFEPARRLHLRDENGASLRRERERPAVAVFRLAGIESQPTSLKVKVVILPRQDL